MAQAIGAMMQLLLQREASFRVRPTPAAAFKLPFTKYNLGRDPQKVRDPSISSSPLPGKSGLGDAIVQGSIESILDLRSIGHLLALLLGVPTTGKAVTKQPTNVTGVTAQYAQSATPAGAGTLTFVSAAKTLAWKAQGDATAGTAVDVSAGGTYTLQSGTASHALTVTVNTGALASADKSDTDIAVSTTLKCHVFPINLGVRPSALLELGHLDTGTYYRTLGAKINKLSYDLTAREQNITLDVLAGDETEYATAHDAAPTAYASVRACGSGGVISNGVDATLGTIVSGTIEINNNMTGYPLVDGREGYGLMDQGELNIGGKIKTIFDGAGAYQLARTSTSTRLRVGSTSVDGADTFALYWDIPNTELVEQAVPKEGKSGLFVELDWSAHRDTAGSLPVVTLINDVAGY
jgi:hypothetical protein